MNDTKPQFDFVGRNHLPGDDLKSFERGHQGGVARQDLFVGLFSKRYVRLVGETGANFLSVPFPEGPEERLEGCLRAAPTGVGQQFLGHERTGIRGAKLGGVRIGQRRQL